MTRRRRRDDRLSLQLLSLPLPGLPGLRRQRVHPHLDVVETTPSDPRSLAPTEALLRHGSQRRSDRASLIRLEIPGRPVPWERVRTNHGRFFKPPRTRDYEEQIAWACRAARKKIGDVPCDISIELYEDKTVVLLTPAVDAPKRKLRGDCDNYAKSILDGLQQGGMIENDRQVNELHLTFPAPSA